MTGVRRDMATLGPGWNQALEDYALAMEAMDALPASDRRSWKFLAAIHGFHKGRWVEEGAMDPATPVPAEYENLTYGKQCQHRNWYFLPWHRGYLASFESVVAAKVMELTGRQWALPYWNYLDATNPNARKIPQPFRPIHSSNTASQTMSRYRLANPVSTCRRCAKMTFSSMAAAAQVPSALAAREPVRSPLRE
jgi:tyrosinase